MKYKNILIGATVAAAAISAASVALADDSAAATSSSACPVVSSFMKAGIANDAAQVAKLQRFLKDAQSLDVDITGVFDDKTVAAVEAFQKKYADIVLAPWDATKASGIVYITTAKAVNQLACSIPLALDGNELAVIAAYKAKLASSQDASGTMTVSVPTPAPSVTAPAPVANPGDATLTTGPSVDLNADGTALTGDSVQPADNTAAVGNASLMSRFWQFLKGLF